jgi:DNA-binding NtrC family response regulator
MTDKSNGSILMLDDDLLVTDTLGALFREESPWDVDLFNSPSAALASMNKRSYHVVISDFVMPEMDGISFLKQARKLQPSTSRILLTGYADKENAIRSINEAGLYHYIEKPWDNDALLFVLRNAVERSQMIEELDSRMARLAERDCSLEALRSRLMKAIL